MSDDTADQGSGEISGEIGGLQDAAAQLTRERAERSEEAARRPAPRERTEEEDQRDEEGRKTFRDQVRKSTEASLAEEGRKFNARAAAEMLAQVREFERTQAQDHEAADLATEPAAQPEAKPGDAQEITEPDAHPKVREALDRLTQQQQQYQSGLRTLFEITRANAMRDFPDVSTETDINALQYTDPPRYAKLVQTVQALAATHAEASNAIARQTQAQQARFQHFATQQDAEFRGRHPELNDAATYHKATDNTIKALKSYGFSDAEMASAYNAIPAMRDSRMQSLFYDVAKYHAARAAAEKARVRTVPSVQRPGTARISGEDDPSEYQRLSERMGSNLNIKQAQQLLLAKRAGKAKR